MKQSTLAGHYEAAVDRESAYEQLSARAQPAAPEKQAKAEPAQAGSSSFGSALEGFAKSAMRAAGSQVGRQIMRGLFESMVGSPAPRQRRRR